MSKQLVAFRLPVPLVTWLAAQAGERKRTELVENLLTAYRDGRLRMVDEPVPSASVVSDLLTAYRERRIWITATPAPNVVNTGTDADVPVFVCHNPQ